MLGLNNSGLILPILTWDLYASYLYATNYLFGGNGTISLKSKAIGSRYFMTSKLYFKGGISEQQIARAHTDWKVGVTAYVLDFSIGSQIQLGHFIIGLDWIGLSSRPFSSTTTEYTASALYPESPSSAKSAMSDSGRLRGPNFYLGYSF